MNFRKDINGLRAFAVIAVILFHFNPAWLPGGFVGVDVFFVISGYLMTGIIFEGLQRGSFSLIRFYLARAKRIIPALAVVCMALLLFGYLFVIPKDFELLSKHALSSIAFLSNLVYAGESSYFDAGSSEKWLLHTWSLSVEWQFYIIYPILLSVAARLLHFGRVKALIVIGGLVGYLYCIYATHVDPTSAFFLLPARAWEMLVGGAAYVYPIRLKGYRSKITESCGWVAILASCIFLKESDGWPGYLAIIPVLGAYLIIQADSDNSVLSANYIAQKVGMYSYSLYLWHWPIIVAAGYLQAEKNALILLIALLGFSFISYHLAEQRKLNNKILASFSCAILGACAMVYHFSGLQYRVSPEFQLNEEQYHREYYGGAGFSANKLIRFGREKDIVDAVMVGDSFGLQYAESYSKIAQEKGLYFSALFDHGCLILPNFTRYLNGAEDQECSKEYARLLAELENNSSSPLVLAYYWDGYKANSGYKGEGKIVVFDNPESYYQLLRDELKQLFVAGGTNRRYFLVGVPQKAKTFAFRCLAQTELLGSRILKSCETEEPLNESEINTALSRIASLYKNVSFVDPNDVLCPAGRCVTISERKPIHSDRSHLSVHGAEIVAPYILRYLEIQNHAGFAGR